MVKEDKRPIMMMIVKLPSCPTIDLKMMTKFKRTLIANVDNTEQFVFFDDRKEYLLKSN